MMSNYKNLFIVLLLFALAISLGSCRIKEEQAPQQDYSGIELTYYKVYDDEEVMEPIIAQYMADHPGLTIHYRKFSDFSEYENVILNELAEGEGPDIFSMPNTWYISNFKKLAPMPTSKGTVSDFQDIFVDVAYQDLVRTDLNGLEQVYALPMTVDTLAIYYNKAHFEDRIPTRGKPQPTWEGIEEDIGLLTKEDNSFERFEVAGIAMGRADNISRAVDILYLLFLQYGAEFYNDNMSESIFGSSQGGVGNYPGADALEFYTDFADPNQKSFTWNEYIADHNSDAKEIDAFASGKVSMIIGYSFMYDEIENRINVLKSRGVKTIDIKDVKVAPIPQLIDPEVSQEKRVAYASYFAETVSRTSEYPDIAWDFLVHVVNKDNLEFYFEKTHKPTSRRDMIDDQKVNPIYGVFVNQIGFAESFPIIDYFRYKEIFEDVIYQSNEVGTFRKSLEDAEGLINNLLPEEGYIVPKVELSPEELEELEAAESV